MNIPQLQIQTTRGVLGLQITKPTQEIQQPRATQTIQQPAATLEMSSTRSQLSIDTTENRADIDMKSVFRRSADNAQLGKQSLMDGIARRAQEGQQLMQIENGGNPLADIAKHNGTPPPDLIGIRFVGDRSKIQMSITQGTTNINATAQKSIHNVQINKPIHNYTQGKVTGQMEQWPDIQIDVKW